MSVAVESPLQQVAPKTPKALRGRGHAWLCDVSDAKKFVEECPEEKEAQLWMKVRDAVVTAFSEDEEEDLGVEQGVTACRMLEAYPKKDRKDGVVLRNPDVQAAAVVLHNRLLSLYDTPHVQEAVADALAALLASEMVPPGAILNKLLMWCVYSCSQPDVKKSDLSRLHSVRQFFSSINWTDPRVGDFLGHVHELVNPIFLNSPMGVDIMKVLFAQGAGVARSLHKQFCVKTTKACRFHESARTVYTACLTKVWDSLSGLNVAVFEHEVIKPILVLSLKADTSIFFVFKEFIQLLKKTETPRVREGLNRLCTDSDLLAGLDAPNGVIRKNCVSILGDCYPVGGGGGKADLEKAKVEQLNLVYRAANDPCSAVRTSAVTALLQIIGGNWGALPNQAVLPMLDKVFTKFAYDKTDAAVRCAVLKGIRTELLVVPHLYEILKKLVTTLTHLDDQNSRARLLYAQLVLEISQNPCFELAAIISDSALIRRIGVEGNKQVLEALIKIACSGVWSDSADEESRKRNYKKMLLIATQYPSAAFGLYSGLAGRTAASPTVFLPTVEMVAQWLVGSTTLKTTKQVEAVLAVLGTVLTKLKKKILTKKRAKAHAVEIFNEDFMTTVEEKYQGEGVTQVLNQIRSVVTEFASDRQPCEDALEAFKTDEKISPTDPSWKLSLQKLLSYNKTTEVLDIVLGWLDDETCIEKALLVTTELIHHKTSVNKINDEPRWKQVWEALEIRLEAVTRVMRTPMVKDMKEEESRLVANQVELFGRIALHSRCNGVQAATPKRSGKKKVTPETDSTTPCEATTTTTTTTTTLDLEKTTKIMVDSLLPAAKRAKRNGGGLVAVGVAEQVLEYVKKSVACYEIVKRGEVEVKGLNAAQMVDMVLAVDTHLTGSVLDFVGVCLEMQVAHLVFQNWVGFTVGILRKLTTGCDDLLSGDREGIEPFQNNDDTVKSSWNSLNDVGLYRKHLIKFAGYVRVQSSGEGLKELCDAMWVWGCDVGGYSVAGVVIADVFSAGKNYLNYFFTIVVNLLARSQGDISSEEATMIAAIFGAMLATRSRGLIQTLLTFKTEKLDSFFKSHALFTTTALPDPSDGDLFTSTPASTLVSNITLLSSYLEVMDWSVPLPQIKQSQKTQSEAGDETEEEGGLLSAAEEPALKKRKTAKGKQQKKKPQNTGKKEVAEQPATDGKKRKKKNNA